MVPMSPELSSTAKESPCLSVRSGWSVSDVCDSMSYSDHTLGCVPPGLVFKSRSPLASVIDPVPREPRQCSRGQAIQTRAAQSNTFVVHLFRPMRRPRSSVLVEQRPTASAHKLPHSQQPSAWM